MSTVRRLHLLDVKKFNQVKPEKDMKMKTNPNTVAPYNSDPKRDQALRALLQQRQKGCPATWEIIPPPIAHSLLAIDAQNRPTSRANVERLLNAIACGAWQANGETIIIDSQGRILDGKHRLIAVVESGIPICCLVVRGVPSEVWPTIDIGKVRMIADALSRLHLKNTVVIGAAVRRLIPYYTRKGAVVTPPMAAQWVLRKGTDLQAVAEAARYIEAHGGQEKLDQRVQQVIVEHGLPPDLDLDAEEEVLC